MLDPSTGGCKRLHVLMIGPERQLCKHNAALYMFTQLAVLTALQQSQSAGQSPIFHHLSALTFSRTDAASRL
jgi:hypothetical protein